MMNWHSYNGLDWIIVLILLASVGFGIVRGFVRETLSLIILILATLNAYLLGDKMATLLVDWISKPSLRVSIGMIVLFVMTLLVGALLNHVLSEMIKKSGLTAADRILGMFFGLARGIIIVMLLTLFMPASIKQTTSWQHSTLVPPFQAWELESRASVQSAGAFVHRSITHKE